MPETIDLLHLYGVIERTVHIRGITDEEAEELAHEAFTRLLEQLREYECRGQSVSRVFGLAVRIARRVLADAFRLRARYHFTLRDDQPDHRDHEEDILLRDLAAAILSQLNEVQRKVFDAVSEGLTRVEAAAALGISQHGVRWAWEGVLATIRRLAGENHWEAPGNY